jgi:hypothetical protein
MNVNRVIWAGTLLALSLTAGAADKSESRFTADTADKFAEAVTAVREQMSPGGRYEFITVDNRAKAEADMDKMSALFHQRATVEQMSQDQRIALFNAQEHLNGLLTHSDRDRLVCERRAPIGTNIPVTTCKTVAEIEKARRDSQKYLHDHDRDANVNNAAMHRESGGFGGHGQ